MTLRTSRRHHRGIHFQVWLLLFGLSTSFVLWTGTGFEFSIMLRFPIYLMALMSLLYFIRNESIIGNYHKSHLSRYLLLLPILILLFPVATVLLDRLLHIQTNKSDYFTLLPVGIPWSIIFVVFLFLYDRWLILNKKRTNLLSEITELKSTYDRKINTSRAIEISQHFLFNTMNTISVTIRKGNAELAQSMIDDLSDLLREYFRPGSGEIIPLTQEIDLLKKYIGLEKIRFGEQIQVDIDITDQIHDWQVPAFILQPLVENSIKYGTKRGEELKIKVKIDLKDEKLFMRIYNNNSRFEINKTNSRGSGIALENIVSRLQRHYDHNFSFKTINEHNGVSIQLLLMKNLADNE